MVYLSDCWSIGKMQACEGPASEVHLFDHRHCVRIGVQPELERESKLGASFRVLESRKDS